MWGCVKRKNKGERQREGENGNYPLLYNMVTAASLQNRGMSFVLSRNNDEAPRSLTPILSVTQRSQALAGIGRCLIRGAPDYIIQARNEDFHVYFREHPLFTKRENMNVFLTALDFSSFLPVMLVTELMRRVSSQRR